MAFSQANQYNSVFRGEDGDVFSRKPNAFLVEQIRNRKPGRALDVGLGQGRNSIYLAQKGWEVTGIDTSDVGIEQARAEASRLGLKIHAELTSFEQFDFGEAKWTDCAKSGSSFEAGRCRDRRGSPSRHAKSLACGYL